MDKNPFFLYSRGITYFNFETPIVLAFPFPATTALPIDFQTNELKPEHSYR
jgi:hypothetical protein